MKNLPFQSRRAEKGRIHHVPRIFLFKRKAAALIFVISKPPFGYYLT
jgi:hypothetical protein